MSSFSGFERNIARVLGRFPGIKKAAKFGYSRLVYLKARKTYRLKSPLKPEVFSVEQQSSFFGYYDKSPINRKGLVLGHSTRQSTQDLPTSEQAIDLVVFDAEKNPVMKLPVAAYNWQQGCRAHWLSDDLFIFNDFSALSRQYISRVFSVETGQEVKQFDRPVQDSFATSYFLSLNYQRLMTLRPDYGYRNLPLMNEKQLAGVESDGIWKVDYETGESHLLVSIAQACELKPHADFQQGLHKLNHVMISPSGNQFIFMHRYLLGKRRFDRLILADADSGELHLLSDYGMVSHCFWVDNSTVLGYLRGPGGKDAYWLINLVTGDFTPFAKGKLDQYGDGHPHVCGDWVVTDTYPDKARMQRLFLANLKTEEIRELGEFFHGFDYLGETRCDLHPRMSSDGRCVFFDSVFSGRRQLYRMDLSQ